MWSFNTLLSVAGTSAERPRMKRTYSSSHFRKPFTTQERQKSVGQVQAHAPAGCTAAVGAAPPHFWWVGSFSLKTSLCHFGKKLLGLARDHVRVSYPTRDCSSILNPVNRPLFGSISQPPRLILLPKCAVPWALPLFLPPTLFLWALLLFSSPMLVTLNFANFSPPLLPLHIQYCYQPFSFAWWKQCRGQSLLSQ